MIREAKELEMCSTLMHVNLCVSIKFSAISLVESFALTIGSSL